MEMRDDFAAAEGAAAWDDVGWGEVELGGVGPKKRERREEMPEAGCVVGVVVAGACVDGEGVGVDCGRCCVTAALLVDADGGGARRRCQMVVGCAGVA